jgi:hypothetical protein
MTEGEIMTLANGLLVTGIAAVGIFVISSATPAEAKTEKIDQSVSQDKPIELDANDCFRRCDDCKGRCASKSGKDREDCESNCHDSSASCCEANGKKPVYHGCGCY